jgi:hypothetical protein
MKRYPEGRKTCGLQDGSAQFLVMYTMKRVKPRVTGIGQRKGDSKKIAATVKIAAMRIS